MLKSFFHRWCHFWETNLSATKPDRTDWFCHLRKCEICNKVEYESFNIFGDKKWHDIYDTTGCWDSEYKEILKSAKHIGFIRCECGAKTCICEINNILASIRR